MAGRAKVIGLDEGWEVLKSKAIDKVEDIIKSGFTVSFEGKLYMDLYTQVYDMCTQKTPNCSEHLYTRYGETLMSYLERVALPEISQKMDVYMLEELVKRWDEHKIMVHWYSRFFSYLDRFYTKRLTLPSLTEVGTSNFKRYVYDKVKANARKSILELIHKERNGEKIDRGLLKRSIQVFIDMDPENLHVYSTDFEEPFIAATAEFYKVTSAKWIVEDSCPDYLKKADDRLQLEQARVSHYLHNSTEEKLLSCIENEILVAHGPLLLEKENSGVRALLNDNKTDDLARMYRMYARVHDGLAPIAKLVRIHIQEEGLSLVKEQTQQLNEADVKEKSKGSPLDGYIELLLNMHDKYYELVIGCFSGNAIFHKAMKEAFEMFVNKDIGKFSTAELMSTFCDNLIKKAEKIADEEMEETLEKVVRLFSYLSDKDMFSEYYRKQLAKRLLLSKNSSDEAEFAMISKLKLRCGAQFTSKLEGMVNDMNVSQDQLSMFSEWIRNNPEKNKSKVEIMVQVLTTGHWPSYKIDELTLPQELISCITTFTDFYGSRTSNRKLKWVHSLGTVTVDARYPSKQYTITVSTFQACILLLFNNTETLSFSDIQSSLNISPEEVKRYVNSLACGKVKFLRKEPDNNKVEPTDVFHFNKEFSDKRAKLKVPLLVTKFTQEEKDATKATVDEDRRHAIEAAIVRVMKSRKQLEHPKLVMEVSNQLMQHFKPDPKAIKKRIEDLIARDYLERDKNNQSLYKYLA